MPATVKEIQSEEMPEKIPAKEIKPAETNIETKSKEPCEPIDTNVSTLSGEGKEETILKSEDIVNKNETNLGNKVEEQKQETDLNKKPGSENKSQSFVDECDESCIRPPVENKAEEESNLLKGNSSDKKSADVHKENENIGNAPQVPDLVKRENLPSEVIRKNIDEDGTAENTLENESAKLDTKDEPLILKNKEGKEVDGSCTSENVSTKNDKCADSSLESSQKDVAVAPSKPLANLKTESPSKDNSEESPSPFMDTENETVLKNNIEGSLKSSGNMENKLLPKELDVSPKQLVNNEDDESLKKDNDEGSSEHLANTETGDLPKINPEVSIKSSANADESMSKDNALGSSRADKETETLPGDQAEGSLKPLAHSITESLATDNTEASSKASTEKSAGSCGTSKMEISGCIKNSIPDSASHSNDSCEPGRSADADPVRVEEVKKLINEAKEQMVLKEFFNSADLFGKACEIAGKLYGDLAVENAELYYQYGCAMLECAKNESTVLGEKLKDKEEESEEDEDGAVTEMDVEENGGVPENSKIEDAADVKGNDVNLDEVKESSENGMDTEAPEENTKDSEEDEDSSLKTAWEMFELAKIIFEKSDNNARLSDTYIKLGEVGLESGHEACVEDMKRALEIRLKYAGDDDRLLAETHFNIGLAYSTFQKFDSAIESFLQSKSMIEAKIEKLKLQSEDKDVEIKELNSLLPDLDEKVQDMKDSKLAKLKELEATINGASDSNNTEGSSSSKPISNITHLVKRKRKLEDVASDLLPSSKQACTDEVQKEESKQ